ncbi:hypothetical protein FA10DRAFT_194273 [Acaromyces ingoldii]|uniref:Uncharacterized protein n=1 Tax=Acaromyces ingoldii TaxID=215250 RepID=A0A316YEL6_9BASI|nr:hypothetical protein FA10DRAFT_194273 [Acaromyces ingoldii]PWN87088.1 hypothetical protein FA10DRAFT_194273 [Acaromyces ingoldii]
MREGRSRWPQESSYGASRGGRWKERERSRARQSSRSASPDLELAQFLADQQAARPRSPKSEAARLERLAAGGAMRIKSRHQKEKEEQERKKREADEEAARAYQDFVQDMEGRPSSERARGVFVRAGGSSTYEPSSRELLQTSFAAPSSSSSTMEEGREEAQAATAVARLRRDPLGKKRGAMGDFLGELQR